MIIKTAFDGQYLTSLQEDDILKASGIKIFNRGQTDYLTAKYEKWLIILHLYQRQYYNMLLKYISKLIFQCNNEE